MTRVAWPHELNLSILLINDFKTKLNKSELNLVNRKNSFIDEAKNFDRMSFSTLLLLPLNIHPVALQEQDGYNNKRTICNYRHCWKIPMLEFKSRDGQ